MKPSWSRAVLTTPLLPASALLISILTLGPLPTCQSSVSWGSVSRPRLHPHQGPTIKLASPMYSPPSSLFRNREPQSHTSWPRSLYYTSPNRAPNIFQGWKILVAISVSLGFPKTVTIRAKLNNNTHHMWALQMH